MATTGFWPVKGNLKDVIDYAENPDKTTDQKYLDDDLYRTLSYTQNDEKTDKKMYVSTINCPKYDPYGAMIATKKQFGKMGGNVAYHGYQSFKPGEVTSEEAHKIGMETARKMWGDDYQIVVTTHLNTDSLHNHFVINSVSFKTGRKFEKRFMCWCRKETASTTRSAGRQSRRKQNSKQGPGRSANRLPRFERN